MNETIVHTVAMNGKKKNSFKDCQFDRVIAMIWQILTKQMINRINNIALNII